MSSDYLLNKVKFQDINLSDPFFDSLKERYREFSAWFSRKSEEEAYVFTQDGAIRAFLYLKQERGRVDDVNPPLPDGAHLKIGTFKIEAHGTRLGERLLKKALDIALYYNIPRIYITIFPGIGELISLLQKYGFTLYGTKETENGIENVYVKVLGHQHGDVIKDYPIANVCGANYYLLSIKPEFHSRLFPDSILHNETYDLLSDTSHTNSIHKVYITRMHVDTLRRGDIIVIYRTSDGKGPAHYRSVATSVCVVEEIKSRRDFADIDGYYSYAGKYSVFSEDELRWFYSNWMNLKIIKMTYNIAFKKKVIRKTLIEEIGISCDYWGFCQISKDQLIKICDTGEVDARLIVDQA